MSIGANRLLFMMNEILEEDITDFASSFTLANEFGKSSVLVTGATGLIGSTLVRCLLALDRDVHLVCPVRSVEKAYQLLGDKALYVEWIEGDLLDVLEKLHVGCDYIVHCASPTAGGYMIEHPAGTYELAIESTRMLLRYAMTCSAKSMVYISSLEYYGQNMDDHVIDENFVGLVDASSPRSSYPLGKRAAEYLCFAYAREYGVNVKTARLTQTFGAGVAAEDNRVFAQFAKSVMHGEDIVMHTKGESAKPYCYTTDCVSAILYILQKGQNGEAYNVANPDTYISIKEMADFLCGEFNSRVKVLVEEHPEMGYAPVTKLRLSAEKLMRLGWRPRYGLKEMFDRLIKWYN